MTEPLTVGVFIVLIGAYGILSWRAQQNLKKRGLQAALALLERAALQTNAASGTLGGRSIEVRMTTRGSGRNARSWTEVPVDVATVDVDVTLRPQTLAASAWRAATSGMDTRIGDPAFDGAFLVEGAPEAAARAVLDDPSLRSALLELSPVEVTREVVGLRVSKEGWQDADAVARMIHVGAELAERIERAAQGAQAAEGAPYRQHEGARAIDPSVEAELRRLDAIRTRQARIRTILLGVIVLLCFGAVVAPCVIPR